MITVIDYHKGNLMSVERGLAAQGVEVLVTDDAEAIAEADALVLPGVGAFADAAATMARLGQTEAVLAAIGRGAAFLGICLGMHLMFEAGEEGAEPGSPLPRGLGLVPGVVRRLPRRGADGTTHKVPHVGWNSIAPPVPTQQAERAAAAASPGTPSCAPGPSSPAEAGPLGLSPQPNVPCEPSLSEPGPRGFRASPLLDGIAPGEYFYFTHSYAAPESVATIACTQHSVSFPSAVQASDRVVGVQFHPEKSSDAGARLLHNFVTMAASPSRLAGRGATIR